MSRKPQDLQKRFWSKVRKTDSCWEWTSTFNNGYGRFATCSNAISTQHYAHRFSYTLCKGPIPEGMTIDHICRNKKCVNPNHLELVTLKENILRGFSPSAVNARRTHCFQGHPFSGKNLIIEGRHRRCRMCHYIRNNRYARGRYVQ
jgi:hypothetical protein